MRLGQLIDGMEIEDFKGDPGLVIEGIAYDSRLVKPGLVFVALRGHERDGHQYIEEAISKGAVAVVSERVLPEALIIEGLRGIDPRVATIHVIDSRKALSRLAVRFYQRPFKQMNLIGITGTNGKTTTSYLLESILIAAGKDPGVIGTVNYRISDQVWKAPVTTPESLDLMRVLRKMADQGATDVIMEVSSHALDQGRVRDCPFRVAIFTNISRDHLDYHGSMDSYFDAKALLFRGLKKPEHRGHAIAVINGDDPKGKDLGELTDAKILTYGLGTGCDVRAVSVSVKREGLTGRLITPEGETDIYSPLIGDFDIYNILAAAAGALSLGIGLDRVTAGIGGLKGVPGRMELVENDRSLAIVVDYAHTPDALLKALEAGRRLTNGRLLTVFGCGGDRDKGKRAQMGLVAGQESDMVFITSDNPRTEDPMAIAEQIEKGVMESGLKEYLLDLDRRSAIRRAVKMAGNGDLVLIAGKGHEDYQIIGTKRREFDDQKVAAEAASGLLPSQGGSSDDRLG